MEKEKYVAPETEVVEFETVDMMTGSREPINPDFER